MKNCFRLLGLMFGMLLVANLAFGQAASPDPVVPAVTPAPVEVPADKPAEPVAPVAVPAPVSEELKIGTTMENLQAAYNGESNARERYLAFAEKAEQEKYLQVARLFRAAAKSEEVHVAGRAKLIEKLGGKPVADIQKPEVKSTRENLEASVKGELWESEKMYPAFAKKAEEEKVEMAMKMFKGTMVVENDHAKFYQDALANIETMKEAKTEYLVCLVCGKTTTDMDLKKCPICEAPREKFEVIK